MNKAKETFVLGFAIFAAFFGAGNLILPPLLGFKGGTDWWLVVFGFISSATLIPLMALYGHAKLQGTMMDFGKKVSLRFSLVFSVCVYIIAITLACPRTAAVTHEMAIQPYFGSSALLTSSVYFSLVFIFAINRGKVLEILGKYLTPIIGIILLVIIVLGVFGESGSVLTSTFDKPYIKGFIEGYQTYDAIAGLLTGGIIVISVNRMKTKMTREEKKQMVAKSGLIAMSGLFIIYAGLIYIGAKYNGLFDQHISRPELLIALTHQTLGSVGTSFLSVLVAVACFTTAVGIIVGTADFFKGLFKNDHKVYLITAALASLFGIAMGQFEVRFIIDTAVYILMFIYPIAIVLILMNVLPERLGSPIVFKAVVAIAFLFSIPDFLKFLIPIENLEVIYNIVPYSKEGLGWVLPAMLTFAILNVRIFFKPNMDKEMDRQFKS